MRSIMMKTFQLLSVLVLASAAVPCVAAPTCGSSVDPAAVVQAQVEAYNKHDVDAFLSCYADNATITWLDGKKPPVQGTEAIRKEFAFLGRIPAAGAGFGVDIVTKTVTGPTVANVEHMRGLPPNAAPVPDTLVIYEVRAGKIVNAWFAPAK
jgi:uncharacterized protein (TIGR02246 family)